MSKINASSRKEVVAPLIRWEHWTAETAAGSPVSRESQFHKQIPVKKKKSNIQLKKNPAAVCFFLWERGEGRVQASVQDKSEKVKTEN